MAVGRYNGIEIYELMSQDDDCSAVHPFTLQCKALEYNASEITGVKATYFPPLKV